MEEDFEEIKKILTTPIALRSPKMIQILMKLTKSITFFKNLIEELGEKMHYRICEFLNLLYKEAESVLFSQGDLGDNFYILLEGKVKLLIWQTDNVEEGQSEIAQLGSGQSFGELSLIKNRPRNATVYCIQSCYFMTLSKDNYLRLLGKSASKMLEDKIDFLHNLTMFNKWSKGSIEKISFSFEQRSYKQHEIIYEAGQCANGAFVIIKGEVELTISNKDKNDFPKKLKVALIGEKDFFGDEEVLNDTKRKYTARCNSKVLSVYFITKSDFLNRISSDSLEFLVRGNSIRNQFRESRIDSIKKYSKEKIISVTPDIKKKSQFVIKFTPRLKQDRKSNTRNLCLSENLLKKIRKRSLVNIASPTASILSSHSIIKQPRSVRTFYHSKGFQPKNQLPSGIFQRIQSRMRTL